MKVVSFKTVSDLIKKSEYVNSIDEVWIDYDGCSVMIVKDCSIDAKGLTDYLLEELGESFEVNESESYDDRIEQWKKANGIDDDKNVYIYAVQLQLDTDVIDDIIQEEFYVKEYDYDFSYKAVLEGNVSDDDILEVFDKYSIGRDRFSVEVKSLSFFDFTEVEIEVY